MAHIDQNEKIETFTLDGVTFHVAHAVCMDATEGGWDEDSAFVIEAKKDGKTMARRDDIEVESHMRNTVRKLKTDAEYRKQFIQKYAEVNA